ETGGGSDHSELRTEHSNQRAARGSYCFQNRHFAHATVSRPHDARRKDYQPAKNRESRDEPNSKTDSVHDALNNFENIGGIDDGNSRKLLEDASLNGSDPLWFDAQSTVIDSRKDVERTRIHDELSVVSYGKRLSPPNIQHACPDISSQRRPFDHTSNFQTECLGSKFLNRHQGLLWLRLPPGPVEKHRFGRNVSRTSEYELCIE